MKGKFYLGNNIKVYILNNYAAKYYLDCIATDEYQSAGWLDH